MRVLLDAFEGREDVLVAKIETAATRVTADFAATIGRIEGMLEARGHTLGPPAVPSERVVLERAMWASFHTPNGGMVAGVDWPVTLQPLAKGSTVEA